MKAYEIKNNGESDYIAAENQLQALNFWLKHTENINLDDVDEIIEMSEKDCENATITIEGESPQKFSEFMKKQNTTCYIAGTWYI